jgi:hypothetical protein
MARSSTARPLGTCEIRVDIDGVDRLPLSFSSTPVDPPKSSMSLVSATPVINGSVAELEVRNLLIGDRYLVAFCAAGAPDDIDLSKAACQYALDESPTPLYLSADPRGGALHFSARLDVRAPRQRPLDCPSDGCEILVIGGGDHVFTRLAVPTV